MDSDTGKIVASVPIPGDVDDLSFDPARKRIYASCGDGAIAVIRQVDADRYESLATITTVKRRPHVDLQSRRRMSLPRGAAAGGASGAERPRDLGLSGSAVSVEWRPRTGARVGRTTVHRKCSRAEVILTEPVPEAVAETSGSSRTPHPDAEGPSSFSLGELCLYFLRLGALRFRRPNRPRRLHAARPGRDAGWISKQDYREGLALAQLAPGPLAAQLAIYLGWVRARVLGATLVGIAFILPSFLMVLALSAFYVRFGGSGWMQGAFYGIGATVIAIIARSAVKLDPDDLGTPSASLGALRRQRRHHRLDRVGNRLGFLAQRSRGAARQGTAAVRPRATAGLGRARCRRGC